MRKKSVICIATSRDQADSIMYGLKDVGFAPDDISVLFPDKSSAREFAHEKNTKAPEGATTGAATGGVIGGAFGWLAGIGALAIPGVGPFVAAGPIMAALSGVAVGATIGGVGGALVGMGIPEYEARRYEGRVHAGGILISVHTDDAEEVKLARQVFEEAEAQDIATTYESSVHERRGDTPAARRKATALTP